MSVYDQYEQRFSGSAQDDIYGRYERMALEEPPYSPVAIAPPPVPVATTSTAPVMPAPVSPPPQEQPPDYTRYQATYARDPVGMDDMSGVYQQFGVMPPPAPVATAPAAYVPPPPQPLSFGDKAFATGLGVLSTLGDVAETVWNRPVADALRQPLVDWEASQRANINAPPEQTATQPDQSFGADMWSAANRGAANLTGSITGAVGHGLVGIEGAWHDILRQTGLVGKDVVLEPSVVAKAGKAILNNNDVVQRGIELEYPLSPKAASGVFDNPRAFGASVLTNAPNTVVPLSVAIATRNPQAGMAVMGMMEAGNAMRRYSGEMNAMVATGAITQEQADARVLAMGAAYGYTAAKLEGINLTHAAPFIGKYSKGPMGLAVAVAGEAGTEMAQKGAENVYSDVGSGKMPTIESLTKGTAEEGVAALPVTLAFAAAERLLGLKHHGSPSVDAFQKAVSRVEQAQKGIEATPQPPAPAPAPSSPAVSATETAQESSVPQTPGSDAAIATAAAPKESAFIPGEWGETTPPAKPLPAEIIRPSQSVPEPFASEGRSRVIRPADVPPQAAPAPVVTPEQPFVPPARTVMVGGEPMSVTRELPNGGVVVKTAKGGTKVVRPGMFDDVAQPPEPAVHETAPITPEPRVARAEAIPEAAEMDPDDIEFPPREETAKAEPQPAASGSKKKRVQVSIVKSTAKAHLVRTADGRQGWIQKRWLAGDNTVATATLDKAVGHAAERAVKANTASAWKRDLHPVRVARETERAVGVTFRLELTIAEREIEKIAWFPKSMIEGGDGVAMIPGWMLDERAEAMLDEYRAAGARIVSRGIIADMALAKADMAAQAATGTESPVAGTEPQAETAPAEPQSIVDKARAYIDQRKAQRVKRRSKGVKGRSGSSPLFEEFVDKVILGGAYVAEGVRTAVEWTKAMGEELAGLTKTQVNKIFMASLRYAKMTDAEQKDWETRTDGQLEKKRLAYEAKETRAAGPAPAPEQTESPRDDKDTAGVRNAYTVAQREVLGMEERIYAPTIEHQKSIDAARAVLGENPNAAWELIEEIISRPRPVTSDEVALMIVLARSLATRYNQAIDAIIAERKAGREPSRQALDQVDELLRKRQRAFEAYELSGGKQAQAFSMRAVELLPDYSRAAMQRGLIHAQNGKPLSAEQEAKIKELSQKIEELEKIIADNEAARSKLSQAVAVSKRIAKARTDNARTAKRSKPRATINYFFTEEMKNAALARVREKMSAMHSGLDVTILADLAKVGAYYMERGIRGYAAWHKAFMDGLKETMTPDAISEILPHAKEIHSASNELQISNVKDQVVKEARSEAEGELRDARITDGVFAYMKSLIADGMVDREQIIDAVHAAMREIEPDTSRDDAMAAVGGYGRFIPLSGDPISVIARDIRGQARELAKLHDIEAGQQPKKSGMERAIPSEAERQLQQKTRDAIKKAGDDLEGGPDRLATRLDTEKKRLANRIADMAAQIEAGEQRDTSGKPITPDEELAALRLRYDEMKGIYDEVFNGPEVKAAERLRKWEESLAKRTEIYRRKILDRDYSVKAKADPIPMTPKHIHDLYVLDELKSEVATMRRDARLKQATIPAKVLRTIMNASGLIQMVRLGMDLAPMFRQGWRFTRSHPLLSTKAAWRSLRAFTKAGNYRIAREILDDPNAPTYRSAKLELTMRGAGFGKMEEYAATDFADAIPVLSGLARSVTQYGNLARKYQMDIYIDGADGRATMDDLRQYAMDANIMSGRGQAGKAALVFPYLNLFVTAPRMYLASIQSMLGVPLWKSGPHRKAIAKEYARRTAGLAAAYALALAWQAVRNWGEKDDEETGVDMSPLATDFGRVRIGKTTVDLTAGSGRYLTAAARWLSGMSKTTDDRIVTIRDSGAGYGKNTVSDDIGRFLRSKMSPGAGFALDEVTGRNVIGQDIHRDKLIGRGSYAERLAPVSIGNVYDAMRQEGISHGTALSILAILGMGVTTYGDLEYHGGRYPSGGRGRGGGTQRGGRGK